MQAIYSSTPTTGHMAASRGYSCSIPTVMEFPIRTTIAPPHQIPIRLTRMAMAWATPATTASIRPMLIRQILITTVSATLATSARRIHKKFIRGSAAAAFPILIQITTARRTVLILVRPIPTRSFRAPVVVATLIRMATTTG